MNRPLSFKIGTLMLLGPLAFASAGCGDTACEELGEVCPQCNDQTYYDSCTLLVEEELDDVCDAQMSTFQTVCPPPEQ
jgi:hypothetical protein